MMQNNSYEFLTLNYNISEIFGYDNMSNLTNNVTTPLPCHFKLNCTGFCAAVKFHLTYLRPMVLGFGIVFNILTLMTLRHKKLKESPYMYLSALAIADLTAIVPKFLDNVSRDEMVHPTNYYICIFQIYFIYPVMNAAVCAGIWIIIMLTIERFLLIQKPLWMPIQCTLSNGRLKVGIIFLLSFAVNVPKFFWYKVIETGGYEPCNITAHHRIKYHYMGTKVSEAFTWFDSVMIYSIPFIILTIFNTLLIYKVHQRRQSQHELGIMHNVDTIWTREQTRFTVTLIAIVTMFLILVMPSAFADRHIAMVLGISHHTFVGSELHMYQETAHELMHLNLSLNFLMYTIVNSKFKNAFKYMVNQWKKKLCKTCQDQSQYNYQPQRYVCRHELPSASRIPGQYVRVQNHKTNLQATKSNQSTSTRGSLLTLRLSNSSTTTRSTQDGCTTPHPADQVNLNLL